jgi:nucleoside-diphosphate-sugar epimerase
MRVFITGATGFLGGALARSLAASGFDVHALSRTEAGRERLADTAVTWHSGDVTKPETLPAAVAGSDWVVHAAGQLGAAGIPESTYYLVNVVGARNVLAAAQAAGVRRVLHLSSAGVLGPLPPGETADAADETAPLAPSNPYERSKAAAEKVVADFVGRGLPVVTVRPEFVYGPGDRHVLGIFRAIQGRHFFYIGNGRTTCHPVYVDDVVRGLRLALERGAPGEIYHLTGPRPVTIRELAETIAAELGAPAPWLRLPPSLAYLIAVGLETMGQLFNTPAPLSRTGVSFFSENRESTSRKARRELGYAPQVSLEEGIKRSVAWYREAGLLK